MSRIDAIKHAKSFAQKYHLQYVYLADAMFDYWQPHEWVIQALMAVGDDLKSTNPAYGAPLLSLTEAEKGVVRWVHCNPPQDEFVDRRPDGA